MPASLSNPGVCEPSTSRFPCSSVFHAATSPNLSHRPHCGSGPAVMSYPRLRCSQGFPAVGHPAALRDVPLVLQVLDELRHILVYGGLPCGARAVIVVAGPLTSAACRPTPAIPQPGGQRHRCRCQLPDGFHRTVDDVGGSVASLAGSPRFSAPEMRPIRVDDLRGSGRVG